MTHQAFAATVNDRLNAVGSGTARASATVVSLSVRFSDEEIGIALPICVAAAQSALALSHQCNPPDKALIEAICERYQTADTIDRTVLNGWHEDFTATMRGVYAEYPDDLDIVALFAEAALSCRFNLCQRR